MGIYGQGAAFNLRCQAREASLPAKRYMAPPPPAQKTVIVQQPIMQMPTLGMPGIVGQNVTINNGPQNPTAAFLGGFLGGFGSGIFGALNKSGGTQAPQQSGGIDYLANLKTLFPKNAVVADGNGMFTIIKDDGTNFSGDYQAIKAEMNKKNEVKTQGTTTTPETSTPATSTPETSTPDTSTPETSTPATKAHGAKTPAAKSSTPKKAGTGSPENWYRASADNVYKEGAKNNRDISKDAQSVKDADKQKIYDQKTGKTRSKASDYVLGKVLDTKMNETLSAADKELIRQAIVRKNPSVFNKDGSLKPNADLSKLDVPSIKWIKEKCHVKDGAKAGTSVANSGSRAANGEKTIVTGKNGYYVTRDKNGKIRYYNNNKVEITPESFKEKCKNIYNNVNKSKR